VAVLEKDYQRIEQLGLPLAEAKHLLKRNRTGGVCEIVVAAVW
jgi:hypothetical protein